MSEKCKAASGRPPRLPEVAVTLQGNSSAAADLNLSIEDDLLAEIEVLKTERDLFREGFLRLYGAIARAYSARGKLEKRDVEKYARTVETVEPEYRPGYLASMGEVMIEALAEAPNLAALAEEGEEKFTYTTRTRTENRALALVDHIKRTGKGSIKSNEARAVLETHEGRPLDRKVVLRALEAARGLLRASSDKVAGVARIVLSSPSSAPPGLDAGPRPVGGGGDHVNLSRLRKWTVPWDG